MTSFAFGTTVTFVGLRSRLDLNGELGTVLGDISAEGRISVQVRRSDEVVAVKPESLCRGRSGSVSVDELRKISTSGAKAVTDAKRAYKAAAKRQQAEMACLQCGAVGVKLMRCSGCQIVVFCSKECQKRSWSSHKKVCGKRRQRNKRVEDNSLVPNVYGGGNAILPSDFPTVALALPTSLTGYAMEVPVLLPAWLYERSSMMDRDKHVAASVCKSIRYFFKRERSGSARFTPEDISNVCYDTMHAFEQGIKGVREITAEYNAAPDAGYWGPVFTTSCPIPRGWKLDERKCAGAPAEVVERWRRGIERVRTRLGEW